ncbi:hypothetical protein IC229_31835 [Spirosoma sp. BT702]|uniref:Uncharacterized protein n=1 Tax=Spirosoma profusum TaxID=2771354 RepID=A0A927AVL7_9BACT|nr:hypothetical protein [Spirosoma profusum]MBD2705253.1 hypothetical protein [Spirosoma profusum]
MKLVAALLASGLLTVGHFTRLHSSQPDRPQPDSHKSIQPLELKFHPAIATGN